MQRTRKELRDANPDARPCIATVGVFDGVHRGHRYLLDEVIARAQASGLSSAVVTFDEHPRNVLSPDRRLPRIVPAAGRTALLAAAGIDLVASLTFDADLARLSAREFVAMLKDCLAIDGLLVGYDFALGRGREGDFEHLREIGSEMGFWVYQMPAIDSAGLRISSTAIRAALTEGDVERAARLLGRPFSVDLLGCHACAEDQVIVDVPAWQLLPCEGVYEGRVRAGGQSIGAEIVVSSRALRVLSSGSLPPGCEHAELTFIRPIEHGTSSLAFGYASEPVYLFR